MSREIPESHLTNLPLECHRKRAFSSMKSEGKKWLAGVGRSRASRRRRRSPIFGLWLALQGRGPMCARWRSFSNFYFDVSPNRRGGTC
jgi:hypothetical protein